MLGFRFNFSGDKTCNFFDIYDFPNPLLSISSLNLLLNKKYDFYILGYELGFCATIKSLIMKMKILKFINYTNKNKQKIQKNINFMFIFSQSKKSLRNYFCILLIIHKYFFSFRLDTLFLEFDFFKCWIKKFQFCKEFYTSFHTRRLSCY